ncbi:hypothetical protein SAMN06269185_1884 [Natronoarchaeum philippinense]|uniref:Uncharacterized protein n=1 Tax=Natronoarchaeum philippinense TaxID=558529 RepID=A0A285NUW6_NATPI|nr:DUF6517 family protein [Natronoarchaeum philippinense]SNZ12713.1 hypothetical protein SAMN06269185_1884 [Natronoarchaeum philippinense]
MTQRRQILAALVVAVLLLTAGCTKLVLNERAEYTANEASVSDAGLEATGYQHADTQEQTIEESFEVGGVSRTVVASNWISTYNKSLQIQGQQQEAARFAVVSTPAINVLGQTFNPVNEMSHQELLNRFKGQLSGEYEGLDQLEYVESRDEVILDKEVEVSTFQTNATLQGETVELYVHVTTLVHEGDLIVAVGAHPAAFAQERSNTYELMQSIEHSGN